MIVVMGTKAKKATLKKSLKRVNASKSSEAADFLPLEGGPGRKLPNLKPLENASPVLYIGRIPHGFYEKEMEGSLKESIYAYLLVFAAYFGQFGTVKRLRIARNKKTGKSRHFGYIEFESPEVAKIVADTMHNYLLFEHLLQVSVVPLENVHPRL
ncbi:putative RNA-binding protein [Trifolium medium]|uniref:Putative RNA-binding protein n=1 Tax=Trifolium medium TaxID=97028 RepID=A0A392P449_9FABA|nr:putative RNA-binding protein [Trifolium medium]